MRSNALATSVSSNGADKPAASTPGSAIARTPAEMLSRIQALAPAIAARAEEFEQLRRIPDDVIDQLRDIGVFRMSTPVSHGGLEFDYPAILDVLIELAAVNGALGWVTMLGAGHIFYLAYLPRATYDEIYANGPDVFLAGSAGPFGRGEVEDDGYRVTGRWPTASGCQNADWIFAGFFPTRSGENVPAGPRSPEPLLKHVTLPADRFEIEDTWHVSGLQGTGSHHVRLKDSFVPEAFTWRYEDPSCVPGPLFRSGLHMVPLLHSAIAIGIAEAALGEIVALAATGKRQVLATEAMRDSPLFRARLGELEADLKAARAMHGRQTMQLWEAALRDELSLANRKMLSDLQQTSIWVTSTCVRVVDGCYTLGGASAILNSSPLQRHLRDIHTCSQHAAVNANGYVQAGAFRLGLTPDPIVLAPSS